MVSGANRGVGLAVEHPQIDSALLESDPNQRSVGSVSEQKAKGSDHHRLPRARLTRNRRQTRAKRNGDPLEDREVLDMKFGEHLSDR